MIEVYNKKKDSDLDIKKPDKQNFQSHFKCVIIRNAKKFHRKRAKQRFQSADKSIQKIISIENQI